MAKIFKAPWFKKSNIDLNQGENKKRTWTNNDNHKLYVSKRWKVLRRQVLEKIPYCVTCKEQGQIVPAKVVDHITPYELGGDFWNLENLQPLCERCHNRKSAREKHERPPRGGGV